MINIKDVQCMCLFEPQCSVIVLAKVPIVSMARYKGALSGKSRYNLWNNVAGPKPHNVVGAVVRRCGFTLKGSLPNLDFISGARGRHSRLGRRSTGIATLQSPLIGESLHEVKRFLAVRNHKRNQTSKSNTPHFDASRNASRLPSRINEAE